MINERKKVSKMHEKEGAMDTGREQIDLFLRRCDEVMGSRFIIADTKISDLLKSIATSDLLYAYFRDITKNFDYRAAQRKYLDDAPAAPSRGKKMLFPEDPQEKLAFIFCLLVEFDSKKRDLSEFLQEYFYEDGSVYESFYAFTNQVIKPFRNAVKLMFRGGMPKPVPEEPARPRAARTEPAAQAVPAAPAAVPADFGALVAAERDSVYASGLSDADKVDALFILNALEKTQDGVLRAGLLSGYAAFVRASGRGGPYCAALCGKYTELKENV